jgi:glycosyltransferase involved in cell wall biosynthesis
MTKSNSPLFSIILAFRNEAVFLEDCLKSFDQQVLSRDLWEIILVDGCSDDGSREIAEDYVKTHNNSKLVNNPAVIATAGWNRGIEVASGIYFCLASGHSITDKYFLLKAKRILNNNEEFHSLGGRVIKVGFNNLSKSIAAAANIAFAMGGSYYRIGEEPKKVNVIGNGIYLKKMVDVIGRYDESLKRSGDWEFNYRVCANGFNMYFSPELRIKVFTRADYKSIFLQQFRTGFWKVKIWAKHPRSLLLRHIVPSIFVLWLLFIPFSFFFHKIIMLILLFPLLLYIIALIVNARRALKEDAKWYFIILTFPIIHIAYGLGFITGIFRWWKFFKK